MIDYEQPTLFDPKKRKPALVKSPEYDDQRKKQPTPAAWAMTSHWLEVSGETMSAVTTVGRSDERRRLAVVLQAMFDRYHTAGVLAKTSKDKAFLGWLEQHEDSDRENIRDWITFAVKVLGKKRLKYVVDDYRPEWRSVNRQGDAFEQYVKRLTKEETDDFGVEW
jgi:hypothetical protein